MQIPFRTASRPHRQHAGSGTRTVHYRITPVVACMLAVGHSLGIVSGDSAGWQSRAAASPPVIIAQLAVEDSSDANTAKPAPQLLTGSQFEAALERRLSLAWRDEELRHGLSRLSAAREIAIILDRRINPSLQLTLQVKDVSLRELLEVIATESGAGLSVLPGAVYIGPPHAAARLRTLIELAGASLSSASIPPGRKLELLRRETVAWEDLAAPTEILADVLKRFELQAVGFEQVPHDLWSAGTLPGATLTETLCVVLVQFDLSFEAAPSGDTLQIGPMPLSPAVERTLTARRNLDDEQIAAMKAALPDIPIDVRGRRVTVTGTIEQIELLDDLLHPERRVASSGASSRPRTPGRTTFTFTVKGAALNAFMAQLEQQSDFQFEYDEQQLTDAGLRLDRVVTLKMENASAEELFDAMFKPLGIAWELEGRTIKLSPAAN